jgi:hypothetical protein
VRPVRWADASRSTPTSRPGPARVCGEADVVDCGEVAVGPGD